MHKKEKAFQLSSEDSNNEEIAHLKKSPSSSIRGSLSNQVDW